MFLNDQLHYGLGNSLNTNLTTRLFPGAIYNSYQMNIYIQVVDSDGAFTTFVIEQPVTVVPDFTNFLLNIYKIITEDSQFISNIILNQGSHSSSIQELQSFSGLLNQQSLEDKCALYFNMSSKIFPSVYGPLSNYSGVIPVKKLFKTIFFIVINSNIY